MELGHYRRTRIDIARNNTDAGYPTRVIVLSMHNGERLVLEAQHAGANGFVLKENTLEELVTAIDTVMAGGTFTPPHCDQSYAACGVTAKSSINSPTANAKC